VHAQKFIHLSWCDSTELLARFVGERIHDLNLTEILKVKPEDRPKHFRHYQSVNRVKREDLISTENLPDTWTVYDDEIPKWHKAWEQGRVEKTLEDTVNE